MAIKSQGTALTIETVDIGSIVSYTGFDGVVQEIDTTTLASVAKEYEVGLEDFGSFSFEVLIDDSDAGQTALRAAKTAGTTDGYVLTMNTGSRTFDALVTSFSDSAGVDDVVKGSVTLKITGAVA